jgi:hypothetical protein
VANNDAHTALVREALQELALRGYTAWPNQTGAMKTDSGGFLKFGKVGSADIFCILPIQVGDKKLGIHAEFEAKTGTGRQSKNQKLHQEFVVERNGGIYILFRSVPELLNQIVNKINSLT